MADDPQTPLKDTVDGNFGFTEVDTIRIIELQNMDRHLAFSEFSEPIIKLAPRDIEPKQIDYDIALTYLKDALKIRPPQRRIRDLLGKRFKPITAYNLMKSWLWSRVIYTLIWFNMLLAIFEPPQEDSTFNHWDLHRIRLITIFQIVFISFYSFDIYLKIYSHDKREIGQWTYIISFFLFYTFCLSIVTYFFHDSPGCELIYRASRIIRPSFLFYRSRDLKKLARSILRGIPALFEVSALIILFLLLFSFTAYYLFYESADFSGLGQSVYFKSFGESVYSLVILQTTANFPDVMMPSYDKSEWTALFFFIYNVLGIYFLMALVLAVIYQNYSIHILKDVERIRNVRERAIKDAFKVLTYHQKLHFRKQNIPSKQYKKVIYLDIFTRIMKEMRRDLYSKFGGKMDETDFTQQIKWMYLAMANVASNHNQESLSDDDKRKYDNGLDKKQFLQIATFIELDIAKDIAKAKRISVLKKTKKIQTQRNLLVIEKQNNHNISLTKTIPIYWYRFRLKLISFWQWRKEIVCCQKHTETKFIGHAHRMSMTIDSIFHHSTARSLTMDIKDYKRRSTWSDDVISGCSSFEVSTEFILNMFVIFSTIFVILDIYGLSSHIQWFASIIIYVFLFEVIFKIIAFGMRGYLSDSFNKLDFVLSLTAFVFEELLQNTIKIIIIFRIIRLLRLLRALTRFRVILRTSKAVLSSFRSLFILEFCIAYVYAILGMELFDGVINKTIVQNLCENSNTTPAYDPLQVPFWCNIYSTYYYDNNFNSFTRAMVVQMELIVVNNWHIITEMFVLRTSIYTRFYFLGVYFSAVVVVMNVLTAFVLEAFISQYESNENENRRKDNNKESETETETETETEQQNKETYFEDNNEKGIEERMHCVIRLFKPENEVKIYHYTRKLSKALFYEQLYPHIFKAKEEKGANKNKAYNRLSDKEYKAYEKYKEYQRQHTLSNIDMIKEENDSKTQLITPIQNGNHKMTFSIDNAMDLETIESYSNRTSAINGPIVTEALRTPTNVPLTASALINANKTQLPFKAKKTQIKSGTQLNDNEIQTDTTNNAISTITD